MPKSKDMCCGCYKNYYNSMIESGCWSYKDAKVISRTRVGTWQTPPYKWNPQKVLSCYNTPGSSMIEKNDCRVIK